MLSFNMASVRPPTPRQALILQVHPLATAQAWSTTSSFPDADFMFVNVALKPVKVSPSH